MSKLKEHPTIEDAKYLRSIAIWLEGYKEGKGNIDPLGEESLRALWRSVYYMQTESKTSRMTNEKLYDHLVQLKDVFHPKDKFEKGLALRCDLVINEYKRKMEF